MFEIISSVQWRAAEYPITIAELKSVSKELELFLSEDDRNALVDFLACNPEMGDVMPRTGGLRKMRWPCATKTKGKSSGLRIIYYFHDLNMPLYILAVYSKGEKIRLTVREEREMAHFVKMLVREYAQRNQERINAQG